VSSPLDNFLQLGNRLGAGGWRGLSGPVLIVMILSMMVLPLPTIILDLLFTFNIALSIMVLLVSMYTLKPLDFASFPSVLLFSTLLRLSLNVASTRVVLLEGHQGGDAAGKVIEAFGHFLIGGNYAVGIIVFIILTVINFMVITKGAGRIAEVGARFTLDAMPGKQMAIDADLNAGLIGEDVARKRRQEVSQEAEFFGSMDGASKFVRGDAVAGLLIMVINVVGGLLVGVLQHDLDFATSAKTYTILAIGDGLVAQIPSLVISTAAGVVVSRVATDQDVGQQLTSQLFASPKVLAITAVILGLMGLIPGMPHFAFLLLAGALGYGARSMWRKEAAGGSGVGVSGSGGSGSTSAVPTEATEASWDDVALVDTLGLEVGYRLIPMVDSTQDGELIRRIKGLRKKFAQEIGFLSPVIHIRDNLELKPNSYRITLKGVEIGAADAMPGMLMAIDPGQVDAPLPGTLTKDPAFGLDAIWIEPGMRDNAQILGYTVVDASTVVATHLNHLILKHAAELLGRQEVQQLLDRVAKDAPKLTEDLVPKLLSLTVLQKILQNLLEENVGIRDLRTIFETLLEHSPRTTDPTELTGMVRIALGRSITQHLFPGSGEMQVLGIEGNLERILLQAVQNTAGGGLEPGLAETLMQSAQHLVREMEQVGLLPVLVVQHPLRPLMARFLRRNLPQLHVLSLAELPDSRILKVIAVVGAQS
jgi:flagellar biosynthesis protein FlhA